MKCPICNLDLKIEISSWAGNPILQTGIKEIDNLTPSYSTKFFCPQENEVFETESHIYFEVANGKQADNKNLWKKHFCWFYSPSKESNDIIRIEAAIMDRPGIEFKSIVYVDSPNPLSRFANPIYHYTEYFKYCLTNEEVFVYHKSLETMLPFI